MIRQKSSNENFSSVFERIVTK